MTCRVLASINRTFVFFRIENSAMATSNSYTEQFQLISTQTVRKCASIAFDTKFNLLVEAAGEEGLRFRQTNLPPPGSVETGQINRIVFGEVFRYLHVSASHVVFTPYNIMLCCHGNSLCMVRHCTGQLVYRCTLACAKVSGAAFDSASDSFFVSDSTSKSVLCMPYMEFTRSRRLDVTHQIIPSGLCIFANALFISNREAREGAQPCGICYRLEDSRVFKIPKVAISPNVETGTQKPLGDAIQKQYKPVALDDVVALPQAGSQQSKANLIGISSEDKAMYTYRVRFRRNKETAADSSGVFLKFRGRDDKAFNENGGKRIPRCVTTVSSECIAVYFEVQAEGSRPESNGVMVFRLKSAAPQGLNANLSFGASPS